jgi:hypothetical protein
MMAMNRPDGLGDVINLGLTLAEAKLLQAQVQRQVGWNEQQARAGGLDRLTRPGDFVRGRLSV